MAMKVITRKAHGVMDYAVSTLLIASPWLFNFADGGAETIIPIVLGVLAIVYSLGTAYEMGLLKVIPFKIHLLLDIMFGLFLIVSPFVFRFDEQVLWPHLIFGLLAITVVLMTERQPMAEVAKT